MQLTPLIPFRIQINIIKCSKANTSIEFNDISNQITEANCTLMFYGKNKLLLTKVIKMKNIFKVKEKLF